VPLLQLLPAENRKPLPPPALRAAARKVYHKSQHRQRRGRATRVAQTDDS
jgi:hypothetical protein